MELRRIKGGDEDNLGPENDTRGAAVGVTKEEVDIEVETVAE